MLLFIPNEFRFLKIKEFNKAKCEIVSEKLHQLGSDRRLLHLGPSMPKNALAAASALRYSMSALDRCRLGKSVHQATRNVCRSGDSLSGRAPIKMDLLGL